jgi:hypothetical protein
MILRRLTEIALVLAALLILSGLFISYTGQQNPAWPSLLLVVGCGMFVFLPKAASLTDISIKKTYLALLLLAVALVLVVQVSLTLSTGRTPDWEWLTIKWFASVFALCGGVFFVSKAINWRPYRSDLWISLGVFLLAFVLRCFMLVTRSPISIDDEVHFFGANLSTGTPPAFSPFQNLNAFPGLWYWIVYFIYPWIKPFVDRYAFEKMLAAASGAVSIAAWYLVVRIYSGRMIALCTASLLCFLGWHWVNSRFLYVYPFDIGLISLAALSAVAGLRGRVLWLAVVAGVFSCLTLVSQRIGLIVIPFIGYLLLDCFVTSAAVNRRAVVRFGLVWIGSIVLMFLPILIYLLRMDTAEGFMPKQSFAAAGRARSLANIGLSEVQAWLLMTKDVFKQLLVSESDSVRHVFRIGGPILDPVFSLLFLLGLFVAIRESRTQQWARLVLVGFVLFALPMALAFPMDGGPDRGLARRMLGTCFFVAWSAGLGAEVLSRRIVPNRFQAPFIGMLCFLSGIINVHSLFSSYISPSVLSVATVDKDLGVQRASAILTVRGLAQSGIKTLYLGDKEPLPKLLNTKDIKTALGDFPNAEQVVSVDSLRAILQSMSGKSAFVVVPASTATISKHHQDIPTQLADLVPSYLWVPGPVDQHGIPTLWYAFVSL